MYPPRISILAGVSHRPGLITYPSTLKPTEAHRRLLSVVVYLPPPVLVDMFTLPMSVVR